MNGFCRLLEMYLEEGYFPDVAYRLAWREWQYMKREAQEFYYDHPEGVNADEQE